MTSPYPNWDAADRAQDAAALERGELGARRRSRDAGVDGARRASSTRCSRCRRSRRGRSSLALAVAARVRDAADDALRDRGASSSGSRCSRSSAGTSRSRRRARRDRRTGVGPRVAAERLVGDGALRRHRGDAVRDAGRHYFYLRFRSAQWPPPGSPSRPVLGRVVLTLLLVVDERRRCSSRRAPGARRAARRARLARRARSRAGRLPRLRRSHAASGTTSTMSAARQTPTRRSTARCSALTTRTCRSGCCSSSGCSSRLARGLTPLPRSSRLQATAFYWLVVDVLAVAVVVTQVSPRAMSRARVSRSLQWFGLLGGAARVGRRSTSSGFVHRRSRAAAPAGRGIDRARGTVALTGGRRARGRCSREAAAIAVVPRDARRRHDATPPPRPAATSSPCAALVGNVALPRC